MKSNSYLSQLKVSQSFSGNECPQITIHSKLINSIFVFTNVLTLLKTPDPSLNNVALAKYLLNSINQCTFSSCSCNR